MAAIGSLVFCTDCGNLLDPNPSRKEFILCELCGTQNKGQFRHLDNKQTTAIPLTFLTSDTSSKTITTTSKPSAFPSTLRTKLRSDLKVVEQSEMRTDSEINMTCDNCGSAKVRYYTQQLRSADEGTTVFYTCPECGNKWNTNN